MGQSTPSTKRRRIYRWLGGIALLVLLFAYQLLGPCPRIVVSRATTYITEPLMDDGLPDFEHYMLTRVRSGITPENNAAALLWQAIGPCKLNADDSAAVAKELGLDFIPSNDGALIAVRGEANLAQIAEWLKQRKAVSRLGTTEFVSSPNEVEDSFVSDTEIEEQADSVLNNAAKRVWTSDQLPPLAKWVNDNQKPLDLIVEASQRSRLYFPYPSLLNNKNEMLLEMEFVALNEVRAAATSLVTRAMWHAGEKRHEQAWQDLLATHRLSRLIGQGPTMVEQLIAIAVDAIARDGTLALLAEPTLSAKQAQQIQRDLGSLSDFDFLTKTLSDCERLLYVDEITQIGLRGNTGWLDEAEVDMSMFTHFSIDWNVSLQRGNDLFDRLATAARQRDHAARASALMELEAEIEDTDSVPLRTGSGILAAILSRPHRSEAVAQTMVALFGPPAAAFCSAEDRANSYLAMERLAAALALYRIEHDRYPEKLEQLSPVFVDTVPVDLFGEPFQYQRIEDGYLLYTKGLNSQDDGASNEQMHLVEGRAIDDLDLDPDTREAELKKIPEEADDFAIRLPTKPLKLPEVKKAKTDEEDAESAESPKEEEQAAPNGE
jgi:hypothetical protein